MMPQGLEHLFRVGPTKPIGYLPITTIRQRGYAPLTVIYDLETTGRSALLLSSGECFIGNEGAVYAWHEATLKKLLDDNLAALGAWPLVPRAFVLRVAKTTVDPDERPELYALIGRAFDDPRFPFSVAALERRAEEFATAAHARAKQVRKYTGEPYIEHPRTVASLVRSVPHTEEMLAAAWLHDVVEDTGTPLETIRERFGALVALYVEQLTDVSKPKDGNRKVRKALDRAHSAKACSAAMTVKLADIIDNARSIIERDSNFAIVYLKEMRLLLPLLGGGDTTLWASANEIIEKGLSSTPHRGA